MKKRNMFLILLLTIAIFTAVTVICVAASERREDKCEFGNSIMKPMILDGTLTAFGDSITAGYTSPKLEITENSYIRIFADKNNMTLNNFSESSSCLTYSEEQETTSVYEKVISFSDSTDVIIIAAGINDYSRGRELGDFHDTEPTTFYGAMRSVCTFLKENYADETVIFITPIETTRKFKTSIASLNDYRRAIYEIATEYGFNVVDGREMGFPSEECAYSELVMSDGIHPTQKGHEIFAKNLSGVLL